MPPLSPLAKERYETAHKSKPRYQRYLDDGALCHGGTSPADQPEVNIKRYNPDPRVLEGFHHRGEHDVESIYWTMLATFLRARPDGYHGDWDRVPAGTLLEWTWRILNTHQIPSSGGEQSFVSDQRNAILQYSHQEWLLLFPPQMKDVAELMYEISQHVLPEYSFWTWAPGRHDEAHLHEAIQRLIFQYLVDHPDSTMDIPLYTQHLRSDIVFDVSAQPSRSSTPGSRYQCTRAPASVSEHRPTSPSNIRAKNLKSSGTSGSAKPPRVSQPSSRGTPGAHASFLPDPTCAAPPPQYVPAQGALRGEKRLRTSVDERPTKYARPDVEVATRNDSES